MKKKKSVKEVYVCERVRARVGTYAFVCVCFMRAYNIIENMREKKKACERLNKRKKNVDVCVVIYII